MKKTKLIKDFNETELIDLCESLKFPKFHGSQIYKWLFQKNCHSINDMTNIPQKLKEQLNANYEIECLKIFKKNKSKIDNTTKFLLETNDKKFIEVVSMIDDNRHTVCISSQIGCNVDCDFCATGKMGITRNLSSGEITDQLLIVNKHIKQKITNVVFMGMGEPFLNYNNVINAANNFSNPKGFNLSTKKITISTAGILPQIKKFISESQKFKLAISLNASNDASRDAIMPINKKWNISSILNEIKKYKFNKHRVIMFEYVMLAGLNDRKEDALELSKLLKNISCKINLIPFNETYGVYQRPSLKSINSFAKILHENRGEYRVFVRWSKGEDIDAACGQLATNTNA
tara:strand:+ start:1534 stop:2571 length:1038 start_codon:yes stop_codon:yes gene_type:complete